HTKDTSTEISDSDSKTNLAVYIASCTKVTTDENGNQIGNYAQTATNLPIKASGFVRGGLYTGDDVQSLVPVQAFAARGVNYADYILVADTVYSYENGALSEKYREGYFNNDDDGIGACVITNGLVQDVTAGNFDGNVNGVEQVLFTTMQKRSGRNDYFSKIYTYQLKNESWQKDETGYLTDCTGNAYLSLCAFDCDSDGTIVKYKEASRTYTDPEVLALLEATPYFSEKDGGDTGNSATSYGTSKESGGSSSYSNSLTTNVVAGFEWGVDDITAGFACGAGFEATVENNFTWSTEEEQYESYSLTYSNDTGDNMVIVYRRPVITYCYEEKYSGKLHTVSKEGTLATSMIPVDRYNEIAAQNGMDLISDSVLSTPGDPFSYRSTLPDGAATKNDDKQQYNGKGTVEQSFTKGSTTTHSYDYELNTSFNAYGLVFGVKAGGGAGYAHTESTSTMNTTEITKAGAVTCNGTEEYDFQWQFAYWDTTVNGNTVPVLGYVVTDPVAPPSPPSNLSADNIVADSFKLHWTAGSRPADEYRIYRVLDDTNAEPVQVATVDGTKTDCTLSSLRADTTYTYIVKAYAAPGEGISSRGLSVASESLTITTPPEDAEAPTITGPDDVGAKVGGTASFTVNVVLPDKYGSVSYQWQQRKNASGWSKVSDSSIGKTLTLTHVTEEMDGTEYRCALTASYADGSPTYYYSGVGKLTVGRTSVSAALGITGYATGNGDGSIAAP
ncbi:MAG: fibronectin type III domain-containing protein, partial [Oscillospiraceae bacterium]